MRVHSAWALAVSMSVGFSLVACSSTEQAASDEPVTITFEYWDTLLTDPLAGLIDQFEEQNPNITVQATQTAAQQYWTRLQTQITGGNAPDVFVLNGPNFQLYASNDTLLPLDDYIAQDGIDIGAYPEDLIALYSYDGQQYGLPANFSTIGLWYNRDLFDQAGVEYPDEGWTWDDLRTAAATITENVDGAYGIAAGSDPGSFNQEGLYNTIAQAGGYVISEDGQQSGFDDANTIAGLQYWRDLLDAGVSPSYDQMVESSPSQMFQSGTVAMFYGGAWRASQFDQAGVTAADVTVLPSGPEGRQSVIHGVANVVSGASDHPEAAWAFANFLASEESQRAIGEAGAMIPAYDNSQDAWIDSMPNYNLQAYVDQLEETAVFPVSENTAAWQDEIDAILAPAWQGEASVEQAASSVAEMMNSKLAEEN